MEHFIEEDETCNEGPTTFGMIVKSFVAYLIAAGLVILALWLAPGDISARAHDAPSGIPYPARCCWSPEAAPAGRPGDCDEIPTKAVKVGPEGYIVTLSPGDHPMVKAPLRVVVPYEKAEPAQDGMYHICFAYDMSVRCFFAGERMG